MSVVEVESGAPEQFWQDSISFLRELTAVPAAPALVTLLERARSQWGRRVAARTSMHDLLFTHPGDRYPFDECVRVAWRDGVYEFGLWSQRPSVLVAADRCFERSADDVLTSFLTQLTEDHPSGDPP
jgi:hypothetical protein